MSSSGANQANPTTAPPAVWTGQELFQAFTAATQWLSTNREAINALNVFPVPDGDTGTNMSMTMVGAIDAVHQLEQDARADADKVSAKIAYGALMSARGNSGVILSQVFRGFARGIDGRQEIDGRDLARALTGAKEMAYKAVMKPVEGTMLTVVSAAAEDAERAARRSAAMAPVLAAALTGAEDALARTPEQLDILRQAGVVDAGGRGIVAVLEGMKRFAYGEEIPVAADPSEDQPGMEMGFLDQIDELHGGDEFGYCTNFMVFGHAMDFDRCREEIAAMGTSAVVVGDDKVLKVHIHVLNPGPVLDFAVSLGDVRQIKIDNMQEQTRRLAEDRTKDLQSDRQGTPGTNGTTPDGSRSVVAVAAGEGLSDALRSMGASQVIFGGQSMNPSIEELLAAVEDAPYHDVIILPNNPNIVLTANQIPALTKKNVGIVPSRSVPQAIGALGAYNADVEWSENLRSMTDALALVRTVEITRAVRDAEIDGVRVTTGQVIGLLDGHLVASGNDVTPVCTQVLDEIEMDDYEILTLFSGADVTEECATSLAATLRSHYPAVTVEHHQGGQPHYDFVIAIE